MNHTYVFAIKTEKSSGVQEYKRSYCMLLITMVIES